ncbi:MAG: CarD family transcriptional regulator [Candidatus Babeliales bacterium]|jgi:CarD family transcriptional regulator, regulator of rRNA transcription
MFTLNEKVVYPGHGVARVVRIIEKKVAGKSSEFFELKFINKDMTILVPIANVLSVGIRPLSSSKHINDIFKILSEPVTPICHEAVITNWNKRNKEYQGKLRTGDLREICAIYKDLKYIETQKELSFGEKNLLSQTESLLVEEISLVNNLETDKATRQLRLLVQREQQQLSQ